MLPNPRTLAFLCSLLFAFGTTLSLAAQELPVRVLGQEDGLENQAIFALAQDPTGFLWIGTDNGLFRYDGAHFRQFDRNDGLNQPRIFNVFISPDGTVFAATDTALFWLEDNRFHEVRLNGHSIVVGLGSRFAILPPGEILVAGNPGLLSLLRDEKNRAWTASPMRERHPAFDFAGSVHGVAVDHAARIVFGCDQTICSFNPSAKVAGVKFLAHTAPGRYLSFLEDHAGRLYAHSVTHIVSWRDGDVSASDISSSLPKGALDTYASTLIEDRFGKVLTPTDEGFAAWDGHSWKQTTRTSKGAIGGGSSLLTDREGNLWIGTTGRGIIEVLGYGLWENFGTEDGLSSSIIYGLGADPTGKTWFGTSHGVDVLAPHASHVTPSALAIVPGATWINSLAPTPDGGIWAGNRQGELYHVNQRGQIDHRASVSGSIIRIRLDTHGALWTAGPGGLFSIECTAGRVHCRSVGMHGFSDPLGAPEDMEFDAQGALWLVSGRGLSVLRGGALTQIALPVIDSGFSLLTIARDHTLWLAGHIRGVVHIAVEANAARVLDSYTSPQLASDYIEFLDIGPQGSVWAGTDHGVNVIQDGQVSLISEQDGLIWNDSDWQAFLPLPDGSIWIGTSGGVSHLLDPAAVLKRSPFSAVIEEPSYDQVEDFQSGAKIPWSGGTFIAHFSGLTFRDNRTLTYHYKLDGFDQKLITTHFPFARFQQLPPGRYSLTVTAEDPGHHMLSAPATLTFTLTPLWWQTRSFHALLILLGFSLIALIWRWSHMALLAQRERLQRLVAQRTSDLHRLAVTDGLTGLLNRGAIMKALDEETENARILGIPLCLAIVDLDHFKRINDTLGHQAGDAILREAARRIAASVRSTDAVGRYGGEEFLIIFRDVDHEFGVDRCERIREDLCGPPIRYKDQMLHITASIGLAWTSHVADVQENLIASADRALYEAKANGRNRVEFNLVDEPLVHA